MNPVFELSKPRITQLVVLTAAGGYYLASQGHFQIVRFATTLIGTALVAMGTNSLNQIRERNTDALMRRTRNRPLPSGRVSTRTAVAFAITTAAAGLGFLAWQVNLLTAGLAALTLVSYVWWYTSLKPRTSLNTLVGAIPGALPVLGGWTAAGGAIGPPALALFWILFLWQLPHFLALAWIYRDDYRSAQLAMLSVNDTDGRRTAQQAVVYAAALVPVSVLPTLYGVTGQIYFYGALVLSVVYAAAGVMMLIQAAARQVWAGRVFLASIVYLPAVLTLAVVDKVRL